MVLGPGVGLALVVQRLGSEVLEEEGLCFEPNVPASLSVDILVEAVGTVEVAALALVSVQEEHCSVSLVHSQVLLVVPATAGHCSLFLFLDEGHIPPSPVCACDLCCHFYIVRAFLLHHKNGYGHAFDRASGDDHGSLFGHESVFDGSGVGIRLLATDRIPLPEEIVLSCTFGAGG